MNYYLRYLLSALLIALSIHTSLGNPSKTEGGITYTFSDALYTKDGYAIVSGSTNPKGDVKILDEITLTFTETVNNQTKSFDKTVKVKSIASQAFKNNTEITSITANFIESIGSNAFLRCTGLISVKVGDNLKEIGKAAFEQCTALKYVNLPEGLTHIGYEAFYGCTQLFSGSTLEIPSTVTTFQTFLPGDKYGPGDGCKAFANSGVKEVAYNPSIDVPMALFSNCPNLVSVTFNDEVKNIGSNAFLGCTKLGSGSKGVSIPVKCETIEASAFSGCSGMKSLLLYPNLKTINISAFSGCSALTSLTFPTDYVKLTIENQAFAGCTGVKTITFNTSTVPGATITIGDKSFSNLPNLEKLILAEGIVTLGADNFNEAAKLKNFEMRGGSTLGKTPNLPTTITGIGPNCFNGCNSLTQVDLPAPGKTTFIVANSFNKCSGPLKVTTDPGSNNYKFDGSCSNSNGFVGATPRKTEASRSVSRAQGSILITNGSFNNCPNLEVFDLPYTLGEGGGLFNCTKLIYDEYYLPYTETVPSYGIPGYVKKAILKETVRVLEENAIANVGEINMPDSLRVIHPYGINLPEVTELILPDSINEVYPYALDCPKLEKLTVLNPVPPVITNVKKNSRISTAYDSKVTLYVPYGSADAYREAEVWKNFKEIIELENSGIEDLVVEETPSVKVVDGRPVVEGCDTVSVYNMLGIEVYAGNPAGLGALEHGVYIVRAGKTVTKIAI